MWFRQCFFAGNITKFKKVCCGFAQIRNDFWFFLEIWWNKMYEKSNEISKIWRANDIFSGEIPQNLRKKVSLFYRLENFAFFSKKMIEFVQNLLIFV